MLCIKVEATSANVCVGFDVLGLALGLENTFTFEKKANLSFKGFDDEYCNENNLVYKSYKYLFDKLGKNVIPVEIGFNGDIPVSRGLGSSSSLIIAGIFAANHFMGNPLGKDELFDICVELEGHPDNVAPAIYGGLVASYKKDNKNYPNCYRVSDKLKFIAVIPPFELSTQHARSVLPKELSYSDIVHNMSRIVNIPKAFEDGNLELLIDLFDDKMHEPYRSKLIKGYDELKAICLENNCAFAISGSGSTMLIISYDDQIISKIEHVGYDTKLLQVGNGLRIWEV